MATILPSVPPLCSFVSEIFLLDSAFSFHAYLFNPLDTSDVISPFKYSSHLNGAT